MKLLPNPRRLAAPGCPTTHTVSASAGQDRRESPRKCRPHGFAPAAWPWLAALSLVLISTTGCDNVPTFQEIIGQEGDQKQEQTESEKPAQPVAKPIRPLRDAPPPEPEPLEPEEVLAMYMQKKPHTFSDAELAKLAEGLGDKTDLLTELNLNGARFVTDNGMQEIAKFGALQHLNLSATSVTNDGMQNIEGLQNLEVLALTNTRITNSGLEPVAKLGNLRELDVSDTQVENQGIIGLADLANLETLRFSNTKISGHAIANLLKARGGQSLKHIEAKKSSFGAGMGQLKGMKSLETLEAGDCHVNDAAMSGLEGCTNLRVLSLGLNDVTDQGVAFLHRCPNLEEVNFRNNKFIRGPGLEALTRCKQLKSLDLTGTAVAPRFIYDLKKAVPGLKVEKDGRFF